LSIHNFPTLEMRKYRLVAKKGEGTFSEVLKAQNVKDGKYHAIKCMKNRFDSIDQVNNLREIQALRRLSPHEHIISLEEVLYDQPTGRLALVFELMDANLYELIRGRRHYLSPQLIRSYMWQLMKSLDHMHKKGIFHRDIKPENILIESTTDIGKGLKLADFGSCRGIYSKQPYTEYISTRWYRAPECLLTDGFYGPEMDLWGAGCVMFEITSLYPLFPGSNEVDQISRIHKVLGTPSDEILNKFRSKGASNISFDFPPQKPMGIPQLIPHAAPECIDLVVKLLKYDANERITAREAMRHPYFKESRESEAKALNDSSNPMGTAHSSTSISASNTMSNVNTDIIKVNPYSDTKVSSQNGSSNGGSVKPLPSIMGFSANESSAAQLHKLSMSNASTSELQSSQLTKQHSLKAISGPVSNSIASSLPPILGSNQAGMVSAAASQQAKFAFEQKSARSMAMVSGNTQKKKKKYKSSFVQPLSQQQQQQQQPQQPLQVQQKPRVQQNTEGVLRAYGVPKTGETSSIQTSSGNGSGSMIAGGAAGNAYNHPNRQYVAAKKN